VKAGIQKFFSVFGGGGCYAFSIMALAEKIKGAPVDVIPELEKAIKAKYINGDNCFVNTADAFLSSLTGIKFTCTKEGTGYKPKLGDYVIEYWELKDPSGIKPHFVLPEYDPWGKSNTCKYGKIAGYRVFRENKQ
jgi:hypothetical protein